MLRKKPIIYQAFNKRVLILNILLIVIIIEGKEKKKRFVTKHLQKKILSSRILFILM